MFTPRGTVKVAGYDDNGKELLLGEFVCLSTDTKPTEGIANGSTVIEMDTSKLFNFNQDGKAWAEWSWPSGT